MLPNKVLLTDTQIVCFYIFDIVSFCFLFVDVSTPIVSLLKDDKSRFCCNFFISLFLKHALLAPKRRLIDLQKVPF